MMTFFEQNADANFNNICMRSLMPCRPAMYICALKMRSAVGAALPSASLEQPELRRRDVGRPAGTKH